MVAAILLVMVATFCMGQAPADSTVIVPATPDFNLDWLLTADNTIYGMLVLVINYLAPYLPWLRNFKDKGRRALTIGVTLLVGFFFWKLFDAELAWSEVIGMAFTYLVTTLGYDKVLKPAGLKTRSS